jgi:hypothetical protein
MPPINWTYAQLATLWELAQDGLYASEIAVQLGKPESAIIDKAFELGVPLREPTVQIHNEGA